MSSSILLKDEQIYAFRDKIVVEMFRGGVSEVLVTVGCPLGVSPLDALRQRDTGKFSGKGD